MAYCLLVLIVSSTDFTYAAVVFSDSFIIVQHKYTGKEHATYEQNHANPNPFFHFSVSQ